MNNEYILNGKKSLQLDMGGLGNFNLGKFVPQMSDRVPASSIFLGTKWQFCNMEALREFLFKMSLEERNFNFPAWGILCRCVLNFKDRGVA